MSYQDAFAAVPDCKVIWCEYFGSYSGRLLAKLKYKGDTVYLHDWFGSCSGCDSFEAEFCWLDEKNKDYKDRLKKFGFPYVESALPLENIISSLESEGGREWDDELNQMLEKLYSERIGL